MKLILPGGSGHIGRIVARWFRDRGDEVVVLSRSPAEGEVHWDGRTLGDWVKETDGADAVINLAGKSVNCRYHAANREKIYASRLQSTWAVGEAIRQASTPPPVWINASTATIYPDAVTLQGEESRLWSGDERGIPETWLFSFDVAKRWEQALWDAETPCTRKVAARLAMVMSSEPGGALEAYASLAKQGLGGPQGSGGQFVSWVHEEDCCRALAHLIDSELSGPVNIAAHEPLPNREFMRIIRQRLGKGFGLPLPEWLVELGSWLRQTESELVLKSRCVHSPKLRADGFEFTFTKWADAARDLLP